MAHPACLSSLLSYTLSSIQQHMGQWPSIKSLWDFSSCPVWLQYQLRLPVPLYQAFTPVSPWLTSFLSGCLSDDLTDTQLYTWSTNVFYLVAGVEDAENWHGKPMPKERADAIIKLIESQIETNKNLEPKPPIEDSPPVNILDIEMASPPAYTVGEQVGKLFCSLLFKNTQDSSFTLISMDEPVIRLHDM